MSDRRALAPMGALVLAGLAGACGHPEQTVVDNYFRALNAKDNQTLSSFAAVSLDTSGQRVNSWKIVEPGQEERGPAPLVELVKQMKAVDAQLSQNKKDYNAYFLDNPQPVDEVRELLKKDAPIPARLKPYADKWKGFTDKERELKRAMAEAKQAVDHEKRNVALSLGTQDGLEDLTGEMLGKTLGLELTLSESVQPYSMTLRRYEMAPAQGPRIMSRWIVYDVRPKS